ncbi:preprotein translocase subunit SecG [Candidatus Clavichlamydia salmonicola]|uniref:preprotein translocase subunit SecG n=1 Tax=Candidatus Clavichlamydia salmonicola TaxID=469812 RepID=UPI001890CC23|nr:preprotein translocase subunit SecG [Candidatus Clavichlamydia salmonicola]
MSFGYFFVLSIFILVSLFLCLVVLVQESKSMGLGASFGADSGDSLFGASTPDVLKKITVWLSIAFCFGCILLSAWTGHVDERKEIKLRKSSQAKTSNENVTATNSK